jgi:hypothetical protein
VSGIIFPPAKPTLTNHIPGTRWTYVIRRMHYGYRVHIEDGEYHRPIQPWVLVMPSRYRTSSWWRATLSAAQSKAEREAGKP